ICGKPVFALQRGTIYIVVLFSTTCPHCPKTIADLGQLLEKYGDTGVVELQPWSGLQRLTRPARGWTRG
ncbi:hypothetical protein ACC771_07680, partial [Rhizobium ruizarguesonis]